MSLHDPVAAREHFQAFLRRLHDYRRVLGSHENYDEAEALRAELAQIAGAVTPDLDELQVPRHVSWYGNAMPVFESALQPVADPDNIVVQGQMLDLAIQAMETAIGRVQRLAADREREAATPFEKVQQPLNETNVGGPIVFPAPPDDAKITKTGWFGIGLAIGSASGYAAGRYGEQMWWYVAEALQSSQPLRWVLVTLLGAVALVVGGHALNRASDQTFGDHPVRKSVELIVALAAAFASIALGRM